MFSSHFGSSGFVPRVLFKTKTSLSQATDRSERKLFLYASGAMAVRSGTSMSISSTKSYGKKTVANLVEEMVENPDLELLDCSGNSSVKMKSTEALEKLAEPLKTHKGIKKVVPFGYSVIAVLNYCFPNKRRFKVSGGAGGLASRGWAKICARELASVASRGLQGPPATTTHQHPPPPATCDHHLPPPTTYHHPTPMIIII